MLHSLGDLVVQANVCPGSFSALMERVEKFCVVFVGLGFF